MSAPCKFDRACRRPDCYFAHPNGRVVDEGGAPAPAPLMAVPGFRQPGVAAPCKFSFGCTRPDCHFLHPQGRAIDGLAQQHAGMVPFHNAEGINLPESPFGEEAAEVDKMMEEEEKAADKDTWFPAHRNCSCCKGYVNACTAPMCLDLGVCGCTLEDSDIHSAAE